MLDTAIQAPTVLFKTINRADSATFVPQIFIGGQQIPFEQAFQKVEMDGNYISFQAIGDKYNGQEVTIYCPVMASQ